MIKNYLKLAWRVLGRRKFFTFISLFGISFTLATLMLFVSLIQSEFSKKAPMKNSDDLAYISHITIEKQYYDTIPQIDSAIIDGVMTFDTTYQYKESGKSSSSSDFSEQLLVNYFADIPSAEHWTRIATETFDLYINNTKLEVDAIYTTEAYWDIFNFDFIEGRPFDNADVLQDRSVVVVTEEFAKDYFGETVGIVDREIVLNSSSLRIIGMVETPTVSKAMGHSVSQDIFMPVSQMEGYVEKFYFGGFYGVFLKKSAVSIDQLKKDLVNVTGRIPADHPDNPYDQSVIKFKPTTLKEKVADQLYYQADPAKSLRVLWFIVTGLLLLYILMPLLNLVNLNVSRILERSSEIGVRRSFGASRSTILFQFVFENVILTLIGGVIAFIFSSIAIVMINQSKALGNTILQFNVSFFLSCFLICILFGILSGLIPAYRMSKFKIIDALKQKRI